MNQRHRVRIQDIINVWLYQNDSLIAMAKTENLNSAGMYIKTNGLLFPKDSTIDIAFTTENSKPSKRIKAKVVHRTLNYIGVTFLDSK